MRFGTPRCNVERLQLLAILRDDDPVLNAERARLSAWAPANGWDYIEYIDAIDLLTRISDCATDSFHDLEIVAHGNPEECDDVTLGNLRTFGESLRLMTEISWRTIIYLSGCNTGLQVGGDCIARSLAAVSGVPVYGARGYLAGTHAERNERCVPSFTRDGVAYESYEGAVEAAGGDVWRKFGTSLKLADRGHMEIKIATSGFRTVNLPDDKAAQIRTAIEQAIVLPPSEPAPFRIAPDLRFSITLSDGEHIFELLAGGSVLRDPIARRVWQLPGGRAILESLRPFKNGTMPAA